MPIKSYLLFLIGILGWVLTSGLAFFAIDKEDRMTAFAVVGQIALALFAFAGMAAPWIEAWYTKKQHRQRVAQLTPTLASPFLSINPRTITDPRSIVLDISNFSLTHHVEIVGVAPSTQVPGCTYRCDTPLPRNVPAALPTGPNSGVQLTLIEATPPTQPHSRWFHLRVVVSAKIGGAQNVEQHTIDLQVPV